MSPSLIRLTSAFFLLWVLMTTMVHGAPFSCSYSDPPHTLSLAPGASEFPDSYQLSLATPVVNVTAGETCQTATYPYGPGRLHLTSSNVNNYIDDTLPVFLQFEKKYNDSYLLIEWNTAFQCQGAEVSCRWEVILNAEYSCTPTAYHDIHSDPQGTHQFRDTFTAICSHWTYGGGTKIPAGYYNITLLHSSLKSFDGAKWIEPRGTQPHGRLPTTYIGVPNLGDGFQSTFYVQEVQEVNTKTFFHQKSSYLTQGMNQQITGARSFSFTKQSDAATTAVKITYYDNFRCHTRSAVGGGVATMEQCLFEVLVDGISCSPGALTMSMRTDSHTNYMMGKTVKGVCTGLAAGDHTVEVRATGTAEPYLGMLSTTGLLFVEEIAAATVGQEVHTFTTDCTHTADPALDAPVCFPSTQLDTNCVLTCRTITFDKPTATSATKFEFYDSLSCRNNNNNVGSSCDLEIRVNRLSCTNPGPLMFVHTEDATRNHFRSGIGYVGFCSEWGGAPLAAGTHTARVFRRTLTQNPSDSACRDCTYSGVVPYFGEDMTGFLEVSYLEPETQTKCYQS